MGIKGYLYMACVVVAVVTGSKVAGRGVAQAPGSLGLLLLSLAGLMALLGLDLLVFFQDQRGRGHRSGRRRSRRRRDDDIYYLGR